MILPNYIKLKKSKKMKKQSICLLLWSLLVVFAGCKKEDPEEKTEKQFIGTWQQVSVEERINGGSWTDNTDQCALQEIIDLDDDYDHSFSQYSNNPSECGDQTYYGRWDVFDDGKTMVWNIQGIADPIKKKVVTIDGSTMITIHDVHIATPTQIRITYKKQ